MHQFIHVVAGVFIASLMLELLSRLLTAGFIPTPEPGSTFAPNANENRAALTYYQCFEGCGIVHFAADGARITGNPLMAGAPTGVIIGDSFSEAWQVHDEDIAGAVVERIARARGTALNIREYGWGGASVPVYVAVAAAILRALRPEWVAVVLNPSDLGVSGLHNERYWGADIAPDGSLKLYEKPDSDRLASQAGVATTAVRAARKAMARSRFLFLCVKRIQETVREGTARHPPAHRARTPLQHKPRSGR